MNNNCIEILGLNYLEIFKDFNLPIENNKFISISGSNQCGKTTLIRIISGQYQINNTITIYGKRYEDYKFTEINNIIKTVIPTEINFIQNTVEEELIYQVSELPREERKKRVTEVAKMFKLTKYLSNQTKNLSEENTIKLQLALAVINSPKILIIDDLSPYYDKKEIIYITNQLRKLNDINKMTIIMFTNFLESTLLSDYLYIIDKGRVVLEGLPNKILEKDNVLNKIGLNLPFMMDLSVKLRDYDLIENIELDMDRMVDTLWN